VKYISLADMDLKNEKSPSKFYLQAEVNQQYENTPFHHNNKKQYVKIDDEAIKFKLPTCFLWQPLVLL
jgi:hypothetical protein